MNVELNISTHPKGPIVSFHPLILGEANFWAFSAVNEKLIDTLSRAKVAIFPQVFPEALYHLAREVTPHVFPNYDVRFRFRGKGGQFLMFRALGLPCPQGVWLPKIAALGAHPEALPVRWPDYPFVVKSDYDHEGQGVFLVKGSEDLEKALSFLKQREREGLSGFLLQEYLPSPFDLRVVLLGGEDIPVWRKLGPDFRSNLVQGGEVIPCPDRELETKALRLIKKLREKTGINLAAVDFLFREREPLFNEINYVFGRRALEGGFEERLFKAVKEFLKSLPG